MNNIEISIKAYIQARQRIDEWYDAYVSMCKDEGKNTVVLSEDIEPFVSIREAISWAVSLSDKILKSEKNVDAIRFMSGIKFIDNCIKHNKEKFSLYAFCRPGINISVKADDNDAAPVIQAVTMEPSLVFGQAENITEGLKCQHKNYSTEIQGKSIKTIMITLDEILKMFYSFEG